MINLVWELPKLRPKRLQVGHVHHGEVAVVDEANCHIVLVDALAHPGPVPEVIRMASCRREKEKCRIYVIENFR